MRAAIALRADRTPRPADRAPRGARAAVAPFRYARTVAPTGSSLRSVTVVTSSPDETRALGAALATVSEPGDLVCLWGDLGAGKTVVAKGFGAGLGVTATINSPTFVLMANTPGGCRSSTSISIDSPTPRTRWPAASSMSASRLASRSSSGRIGWATRSRPSASTS